VAVQNMPSPGQTWKALCRGLIRLIQGKRIVDLGCGNGRLAILLAQAGNAVTGVDTSEAQIRLARENAQAPASGAAAGDAGGATVSPVFLHAPMETTGLPAAA